jgi:hypothetical protein
VIRFDHDQQKAAAMAATVSQLQREGVTSVLYFPFTGPQYPNMPMQSASQIGYSPEWVLIGWQKYLSDFQLYGPPNQTAHAFGVGVWNKMPDLSLEPWYQAFHAAGGSDSVARGGLIGDGRAFYQELMVLASGIQTAGPGLTPETFAEGLHSTTYPNPGAAGPPFFQGTVGFASDTTMVDDFQEFWLDSRITGPQVVTDKSEGGNTSRASCYVALGRRFALDTWPRTDGFYRGVCR